MRGYEAPKTRVNLLKNVDLSSILTPAKPASHIAGTKGKLRAHHADRDDQCAEDIMKCAKVNSLPRLQTVQFQRALGLSGL